MINRTFDLISPGNSTFIFIGILVLFLSALTLFIAWMSFRSLNTSVRIDNDQLVMDTVLYGKKLPMAEIRRQEVEIIELHKGSLFEPKWRTNGLGMPGFQLGWFKLRNGEKALLAVTDRSRVVRIPTTNGYSIMVSVRQPEMLVESLRTR